MSNDDSKSKTTKSSTPAIAILAWLVVGLPLLWGVGMTVSKAAALFH